MSLRQPAASAASSPLIDAMQYVKRKHGVSYARQVNDIMTLSRRVEPMRYYYYRLYDPALSRADKATFVGTMMQQAMFLACNPFSWWHAAQDKLASAAILRANGVATPKILAVAARDRRDGGALHFDAADAAAAWLLSDAPLPCFGKLVNGSLGEQSFAIIERKDDHVVLADGRTVDRAGLSSMIAAMMDHSGLMVQQKLVQHPDIIRLVGPHTASLRVIILYGKDGPKIWDCAWRIPAGGNAADNFAKPGNVFASVEPGAGKVTHAIRKANRFDIARVETHPDTGGKLPGFRLPDWTAALGAALNASHLYARIGLQSWDVAITAEGPVVLEVNPGGNLDNAQILRGIGLWQGELKAFVQECFRERRNPNIRFPWKKVKNLIEE